MDDLKLNVLIVVRMQTILHNSSRLPTIIVLLLTVSLLIVDNTFFHSLLSDFDPKFVPPCRQSVAYLILPAAACHIQDGESQSPS